MLTDKDIAKLTSVLATKQEVIEIKTELAEVRKDIDGLRETVQGLLSAVDKLVQAIHELRTEYSAMGLQLNRHEKWIKEIAGKVGVKLLD